MSRGSAHDSTPRWSTRSGAPVGPTGASRPVWAGASEVEPTAVAALALRDDTGVAPGSSQRQRRGRRLRRGGRAGRAGRRPPRSRRLCSRRRAGARRALAFAIARSRASAAQRPRSRAPVRLGLDDRHAVARRADLPCAPRRECAYAGRTKRARGGGCAARANASAPTAAGTSATRRSTTSTCTSYPQTTAIALIALQGAADELVRPALGTSGAAGAWSPAGSRSRRPLVAFRLHGEQASIAGPLAALEGLATQPAFRRRPLAVAWAALATGPDALLEPLRSRA